MKHSELIRVKRDLDSLALSDYETNLNISLTGLQTSMTNKDPASIQLTSGITHAREEINNQFAEIRELILDYKRYIYSEIEAQRDQYYSISEEIYQNSLQDTAEYILNRRRKSLTLAEEENRDLFLSRLGMYNSWKYPAIEIRPAQGEITDYIKGCDPLYLVDTDNGLFDEVKKLWHEMYQRRLRYYTIDEQSTTPLKDLPDNQFGLIVSVDYFNFKTLTIIENFLQDFYTKLRPGGIAMFTYNNCDLPYAVRNVDKNFCCYTPGHRVIELAKHAGFELVKNIDRLENISWLELRKPGEITTLRGGQTLGEIRSFD